MEQTEFIGPLIPDLDEHRIRFCVCDKPNDKKQYYYCESCSNWYHDACVEVGKLLINEDDDYICPFCANAFPCANTNCDERAVQVFGDLKSKYCSFNCSTSFIKEVVVDPLLKEIKDMPHRYTLKSSDNSRIQSLQNEISDAEQRYNELRLVYCFYHGQINNWPFNMEDEQVCEFSMQYIFSFANKLELKKQPAEKTCSSIHCARHEFWKPNLHSQYIMASKRYLLQMEYFVGIKKNCLLQAESLKKELSDALRYYTVR